MNFSSRDVFMALYCFITIAGIVLLGFSWYCWKTSLTAEEPLSYWITAGILLIVGVALIIFGFETYILRGDRDDTDIWH